MNRKKTIALIAVIALVATALIGTTLAYFTDSANATNTMTVGNVKIELIEEQRKLDENGQPTINGALEPFTQNKVLMPIVGSAQGEKDSTGQPIAANYVDKIATVKNTGKSPALVRFYFAIPSALDDGYETFNAGLNVLHFNFGNKNGATTANDTWQWMTDGKWNYYETVIDGVNYNVYFANYTEVLLPEQTTTQAVSGLYLDKSFDVKYVTDEDATTGEKTEIAEYYAFNKKLIGIDALLDDEGNLIVNCPVYAVAVQAAGFDVNNANAAFKAAFGEKYDPFGGVPTNWQITE
jgi:predicted ribosomally synthesized peptide with SipW-like signal peptide